MSAPRVWHSLSWRLLSAISLLLASMLAVVLWFATREVQSALTEASSERAQSSAAEVASLLEESSRVGLAQLRLAAAHPDVRAFLRTRDPERLGLAEDAMRRPAGNQRPRTVTLWSLDNVKVAEVVLADETVADRLMPSPTGAPAQEGIGPFRSLDGLTYFDVSALVSDDYPGLNGLGTVVLRSPINPASAEVLRRLVGPDTRIHFGNADGSLWFDISTGVAEAGPPADPGGDTAAILASVMVRNTPWLVSVEMDPVATAAPARQFLRRMIGFGALFSITGILIVAAILRRLTTPLAELTAATEAVAAGDYSRKFGDQRLDEVGRLGRAFDAMTATIDRDVSERKEAARRLQENEDRMRYTLGAARVGTWQMEMESLDVRFSDNMAPLFGLAPPELPESKDGVIALIHPDDREAVIACMAREACDDRDHEIQFRALQPDGSYKWALGRSRMTTDATGASRILGVCFDISEQRLLEERLMQSQKMDAIGKLAGGVAHDFNNLLTAILGFGQFLLDSLDAGDSRRGQVEEILRAGRRAADLTAQLLSFSRQQLVQPAVVDPNAAVTETLSLLSRLVGENIVVEARLDPGIGMVRADPAQLQQIVMNLVINARDAMPEGGRLTVETANVTMDQSYSTPQFAVTPGDYVMLAVVDTGVGITDEVRARMFEPFFTTKARGQGTGLGLATVYGAVKQCGGYVWVYSDPGRGSTFKVYLPRLAADAIPAVTAPVPDRPAGGTETLLLVEDEEAVRSLTSMILERAGYRVVAAANAREAEALHLDYSGAITLLLTDVVLPGASGPELFQRLAMRDPRLKVLYMSGYTDDAVFRTGRLQPGVAFIQKPFSAEGIRRKVREVIDGQ